MSTKSQPTSVRVTVEARRLMALLSDKLGVSQSAVMERAIRELAERQNVVYNALQKQSISKDNSHE